MNCVNPNIIIFSDKVNDLTGEVFKQKILYFNSFNYFKKHSYTFKTETLPFIKDKKAYIVPCGKCLGCKIAKAREWSNRCYLEASLYKNNYFVTLTYETPPVNKLGIYTLRKKHIQDFIHSIRDYFRYNFNHIGIRYFLSGEYGSIKNTHRPHYHILFFNLPLNDLKFIGKHSIYNDFVSDVIFKFWPYGRHTVNELNIDTSFYVARYTTKKLYNDSSKYKDLDIEKEFLLMSTNPGIARNYFDNNVQKIYINNGMNINGRKVHLFRYYDKLYKKYFINDYDFLQFKKEQYQTINFAMLDNVDYFIDQIEKKKVNLENLYDRFKIKKI